MEHESLEREVLQEQGAISLNRTERGSGRDPMEG